MRKIVFVALGFLLLSVSAHAQFFEGLANTNVVAGLIYQTSQPEFGNRTAFMLSANVSGLKPFADIPLYFGGFGVAIPTSIDSVASQFGSFVIGTVPVVTWFPRGNDTGTFWSKILIQGGYSRVIVGEATAKNGIYGGVGYGWNSPAYLEYKREAKRARKAGKTSTVKNPYDVQ